MTYYTMPTDLEIGAFYASSIDIEFLLDVGSDGEVNSCTLLQVPFGALKLSRPQLIQAIGPDRVRAIEDQAILKYYEETPIYA